MDDPKARALFEDNAAGLENVKIIGGSLTDDVLTLQLDGGYPEGRFAVQIRAKAMPQEGDWLTVVPVLEIDFDEPAGAGADPYGRPDPQKHPEAWSE